IHGDSPILTAFIPHARVATFRDFARKRVWRHRGMFSFKGCFLFYHLCHIKGYQPFIIEWDGNDHPPPFRFHNHRTNTRAIKSMARRRPCSRTWIRSWDTHTSRAIEGILPIAVARRKCWKRMVVKDPSKLIAPEGIIGANLAARREMN